MVRSSSTCFKILACGSDAVDKDDLEQTESKESTDKRGWSFRKRSASHRVLSNTVISETPSIGNKESPESIAINSGPQPDSAILEKVSEPQRTDEKPELSTALPTRETDPPLAKAITCNPNLEESVAVVIQAAIRGYLAKRTLLKLKNVVKLQAAVRGHLVRRQAVGTLRCVQAIVKMQALVRARRARLLVEELVNERSEQMVKPLGKEDSETKPNQTYSSTKKLFSNGFARQLLESAPKTKAIHIKCDASRSNSAWNWLERWMSVSSSELAQPDKPVCPENVEQGENIKATASEAGPALPSAVSVTADIKSNSKEAVMALESEESLITYNADDLDFQAGHPNFSSKRDDFDQPHIEDVNLGKAQNADDLCIQDGHSTCPSVKDDLDKPRVEDVCLSVSQDASSEIDLFPTQTEMQSGVISQTVLNSVSENAGLNSEQPKRTMKRVASDQLETEGKKFVFGSRKASNPAFIAAQSKFEELSSSATLGRSINPINEDLGSELKSDNLLSLEDSGLQTKESSLAEYSISHDPKVQVGGSECGTELSISSTLDSPDISEIGGGELEHEAKVAERGADNVNSLANDVHKLRTSCLEAKGFSSTPPLNLSHDVFVQSGKAEEVDNESTDPVVAVGSPRMEQQPNGSVSDVRVQVDNIIDQQACKSSPEGSPRSHMTAPEAHGTPSSQVSIKAKRDKLERRGSNQKRMSHATSNRSPSNQNDSGARSSTEQLPRDSKNGKRRNSFGSARSDPIDQERRDSSSSISLPSYMQATESAKAKAHHTYNSPRSSPDVQDKDIYIKKRHSLPSANGKQGSPRMQRSTSQAQQGVKGNERKWQR
ncbi:protein IQ-DOMAIN 32-like isoform X2 [Telopea speciosissima]|uniref:protein IQ-DOMAIN 32-like isoform X2 n=1 Tax=Telopea speciosissima TaxID=54955 RepID=UPI001CC370AE|nr:protein IQ-DOMAIN 32-like isoform X2 [Telopea speciosissima]